MGRFGALLLLAALRSQIAVRLADTDDLWHVEESDLQEEVADGQEGVAEESDACDEQLRTVFRGLTWADLHGPVFEGTYQIRNRHSGKYLTGTDDGFLGASLHHISFKHSQWKLRRVKAEGVRKFTLQNSASGRFLVFGAGQIFSFKEATSEAHWKVQRADDGVHQVIQSATHENMAITENTSGFVYAGPHEGEKSEWFLHLQQSWLRRPRTDSSGYRSQYRAAADIPMWEGTPLTWFSMCEDSRIQCDASYANMRQGYKALGLISETHRRIVVENKLDVCDTDWIFLEKVFGMSVPVLSAARASGGQACAGKSLKSISVSLKAAAVNECFAGCIAGTIEQFVDLPCREPDNVTEIFMGLYSLPACSDLPPNTVERIAEHAFKRKCSTFQRPTALFSRELHDPTSLTIADGNPVCSVGEKSRNRKDIKQNGVCPSGTTCQCPRTYLRSVTMTRDLTFRGGAMFKEGDATLASVARSQVTSSSRSVMINILVRGMTAQAAVLAVPVSFTFLPFLALRTVPFFVNAATWRCSKDVACWPELPVRMKTADTPRACRIPDKAKSGGSKVWFMPPPGTIVRHRNWYLFRRCEFTMCSQQDMFRQTVGFFQREGKSGKAAEGKPNIWNCVPLTYEEMSEDKQKEYLQILRETVPPQYADEIDD